MGGEMIGIDELASVSGGRLIGKEPAIKTSAPKMSAPKTVSGNSVSSNSITNNQDTAEAFCPKCNGQREFKLFMSGRAVCETCGEQITL